uniref:RNA (guanine-9-)-methyltransferase domain-containing protein 1 n=1 Tax=Culicoides sonorensis TaxID=179676 RepID=A0A336M7A4_CULSO
MYLRLLFLKHNAIKTISNKFRDFCAAETTEIDKNHSIQLDNEAEQYKAIGGNAPDLKQISDYHRKQISNLSGISAKRKYFEYLWKVENRKLNKKLKAEKKRNQIESERPSIAKDENQLKNHLFLYRHFSDTQMNRHLNNKLIKAMQFGQKLVIDCSYDDKMTFRETASTAEQFKRLLVDNRCHNDPFDVHFCNVDINGPVFQNLQRRIPTIFNPEFPVNLHEDHYLEKFPKSKLVYLTPDSKNDLKEFNHDDIYIIGGIVDRVYVAPYSFTKANQENIRTARLPLKKYVKWNANGRGIALAMNQVFKILLDMKTCNDWQKAFMNNIPKRKLDNDKELISSSLEYFKESRFSEEMWGAHKIQKLAHKDLKDSWTLNRFPPMTLNI